MDDVYLIYFNTLFYGPLVGIIRGLDSVSSPTSMRGSWYLWPPGKIPWAPEVLSWPPVDDGADDIDSSKASNTTLGNKSNVPVYRPQNNISGRAQTFHPAIKIFKNVLIVCWGPELNTNQLKI